MRRWTSFEQFSKHTGRVATLSTGLPGGWQPLVHEWERFAASELSVVDLLKKTLFERVKAALSAACPGMCIVGTPTHFPSYGTDENRPESYAEKRIGPDLVVLEGRARPPPGISKLSGRVVVIGDVKLKHPYNTAAERVLPETTGCYESWLTQPVQCCIDLDISLGFVLTNIEVMFFHLCRMEEGSPTRVKTRSAGATGVLDGLTVVTSDDFSSPVVRQAHHWISFEEGDIDIRAIRRCDGALIGHPFSPLLPSSPPIDGPRTPVQHPPSSLTRKRARERTPSPRGLSSSLRLPTTPCLLPQSSSPFPPSSRPSSAETSVRKTNLLIPWTNSSCRVLHCFFFFLDQSLLLAMASTQNMSLWYSTRCR